MLNYKEIEKLASARTDDSVKCPCGHTVLIPLKKDKVICSHCGKYVFKSKRKEFEYRIKQQMLYKN